jgi:two-component system, OmpR family, response regulator
LKVHILIVDDEPHIRFAIAAMLSRQGHRVIEARDAEEALIALQEHPMIKIAICDLYLPGMKGEELVEVIKQMYPDVRVIVTSVFDRRLWEACQRGADHKLVKPFGRQEFLNVFGEVVNRARAYAPSL